MANHFFETHYEEYINEKENNDLHGKISKQIQSICNKPPTNIIFYGPSGVGKYSCALFTLKHYSKSNLNYEKKMVISFNKDNYCYKISDIHFEIDMETLGCNARLLWSEIFNQIEDVVSSRQNKMGIILCKNFHHIHNELLETFYSYMQRNCKTTNLYFYIISESVSFIPDNIINCCLKINVPRPSITQYNKCFKTKIKHNKNINNIKSLRLANTDDDPYVLLCDHIYNYIVIPDTMKYTKFRDVLYDILIYNYNIGTLIYYLCSKLSKENKITNTQQTKIFHTVLLFLKNYNNNYRPIYHLELLMFNIISIVNGF